MEITVNPNLIVAELKLQSCEKANIFYATDITADTNIPQGDYSLQGFWQANEFTHKTKAEEEEIEVNADSTILQGVLKDKIGESFNINFDYVVSVYVWVEMEEECD
ncbi:MAG: hypothetical protein ACT4ON_13245 [Bacteroidota bacterium]